MAAGLQLCTSERFIMRVKIHNGTVSHGESSLCATCRLSTIIRGRTLDEEIVHCHAAPARGMRVTFKVTSCTSYCDARLPSYAQMMEEAWILQPGSKRKPAGFVRASDLPDEDLANIMVEIHKRAID
jgi:hypothetical protein